MHGSIIVERSWAKIERAFHVRLLSIAPLPSRPISKVVAIMETLGISLNRARRSGYAADRPLSTGPGKFIYKRLPISLETLNSNCNIRTDFELLFD